MKQPELMRELERHVQECCGHAFALCEFHSVGGGCINNCFRLDFEDQSSWFVKLNSASSLEMFEAEWKGLEHLGHANCIRVPSILGVPVIIGEQACLLMEWIPSGTKSKQFEETLGRQLAELHRTTARQQFGFDGDNFLGSTPQPNRWMEDWVPFFREQRLGHQLDLAMRSGQADSKLIRQGRRLMDQLDQWLAPPEVACLIHGDLWSGNYLADQQGEPVLVDPAAYFADREAEFGMIELFGNLGAKFHAAYQEAWPMSDGYSERIQIYKLYHLLNHLNLFGRGYLQPCHALIGQFV